MLGEGHRVDGRQPDTCLVDAVELRDQVLEVDVVIRVVVEYQLLEIPSINVRNASHVNDVCAYHCHSAFRISMSSELHIVAESLRSTTSVGAVLRSTTCVGAVLATRPPSARSWLGR